MKRFLIFSDSHGNINDCIRLIEATEPDAVIHAGDYISDVEDLISLYPDITFYCVCGNNDFSRRFPHNILIKTEGKRIFVTHGHEYRVKYESSLTALYEKAKSENADLCIFGHTHVPYTEYRGKMTLLNPGSIKYTKTYAVCEIEDGKMKTCIINA